MGSEGAASHFQARVVIKSPAGYRSVVVPMVDGLTGELVVDVASTDTQLDLVVASVADHYEGNQHYGYQYFIGDESAAFCDGQIVTIDMNSNGGNGTGTAGNDVILGTNGADEIDGLAGDDVICGGDGDDVIKAGPGDDIAHGELGNDRIFGAQGADSLTGGDGDDVLHGNRGNDMLVGGAGDDRIFGYAHNDTIHGGPGNDRLHGNFGNDEVHGGDGDDSVFGYGDNDQLTGGSAEGSAWQYSSAGVWTMLDDDISNTNGPAVIDVDGQSTLIIGDTSAHYFAYDYDAASAGVGPRRVFGDVTDLAGAPDGSSVDAEGGLWCALEASQGRASGDEHHGGDEAAARVDLGDGDETNQLQNRTDTHDGGDIEAFDGNAQRHAQDRGFAASNSERGGEERLRPAELFAEYYSQVAETLDPDHGLKRPDESAG
ncbi:Leukotoxin [Nymphon striatum]|nr:Leukotoxin [Nymphon striatum]